MKTEIQLPSIRIPDSEKETEWPNTETPSRQYIRIFKDSTDPEVWKSYCMGLGLDAETTESFQICNINTSSDIKVDTYTKEGDLVDEAKYCCILPEANKTREEHAR